MLMLRDMTLTFPLLGFLLVCSFWGRAWGMTLPDALSLTRQNAPEPREWQAAAQRATANARAVDAAFDTTVFAESLYNKDRSDSANAAAGQWRDGRRTEVGLRKLLPTGTQAELR